MAVLDELTVAVQTVAEKVGPSVVRVGGGWRGGSGFVIGDGLVLSNAHNVRSDEPTVVFADGRQAQGTLRGIDVDGDLALVSVDTAGVRPLEWASDEAPLGRPVFGVTLNGSGGPRITVGWISALARPFRGPRGRRIAGGIEHTAPLAPGSSGGPLADADGRVVGINTSRLGDGFYLAMPGDEALQRRVAALGRGESAERPRLGVALAPPHAARRMRHAVGLPELDGLLVRLVENGSPAEAAGIAEGDLIVAAAGQQLADADDLYELLGALSPGATLQLRIVRGTEERSVEVSFSPDAVPAAGTDQAGPVH